MLSVSHHLLESIKTESSKSFNRENLSAFFPKNKMYLFKVSACKSLVWNALIIRHGCIYKQKSSFGETEFSTSSMKLFFQLLCYHCQTTPSKISTTSVDLFSPLPLKKPAAAAAKSLQSCPTLCNPIDGSPPGSLVLGFSRQEHWSGLPFPSPMHESEKWKWCHSVVSDPQRCHGLQPSRLLRPWDFPGKSTGVGCH